MTRRLFLCTVVFCLVGMASSSALAQDGFWIQPTLKVNGTTGGITIGPGTMVRAEGRVTYNATFQGIPLPMDGYIQNSFDGRPFGGTGPLVVGGTVAQKPYQYGFNGVTGRNDWVYNDTHLILGHKIADIVAQQRAEWKPCGSGGTVVRNANGSGTGHLIEENVFVAWNWIPNC